MRTTIDAAGRLVIPKAIREQAGLRPGIELDVRLSDGVVEIEPAPSRVTLVQEGRFLVAVFEGDDALPPTVFDIDRSREEMERERGLR
jgi:AbrB family looped-hinge helix DNA binding protein